MDDAEKSIKYGTKSISEAIDSNVQNIANTESTNEIKIRSEHEWLCLADSEEVGHMVEPNLSIVKSEYEIQSSSLTWAVDKIANSDEYKEDCKVDNGDDGNIANNNSVNDCGYDGSGHILKISEPINHNTVKRINKPQENKGTHKEHYSFRKKKGDYFQQYFLRYCPYCGIELESAKAWDKHLRDMHFTYSDDDKVSCNECRTVVSNKDFILKSHTLMHFPYKNIFKCKLCSYACSKYKLLMVHIEINHFDVVGDALSALIGINQYGALKCAYCGKYVGISKMLSTHIQVEHREIYEHKLFYVCPFCGETFVQEKSHKEHLKNIHQFDSLEGMSFEIFEKRENNISNMKFRCLKCSELLADTSNTFSLTNHAMRHLPYKCFKCRFCEYENKSKSKVIQHTCVDLLLDIKNNSMRITRTMPSQFIPRRRQNFDVINKLHVCPKCGETCEQQALWEAHLIKEHNFDKYEYLNIKTAASSDGKSKITSCTICEKIFAKPNAFAIKQHAFKHMPHKIYKCKLCQASTTSVFVCPCKAKLCSILHVCPKCGKEFSRKFNWNKHMMKFHNLRKLSGLNFQKISDTDAPNYKCSLCDTVIQESSPSCTDLLFKHATIEHMPFKCYKCNYCGKQTNSNDSVIEHCGNCLKNRENGGASNTKTKSKSITNRKRMLSTEDTVENTGDTKETDEPLHKIIKQRKCSSFIRVCPKCGKEFKKKFYWNNHMIKKHDLREMSGLNFHKISDTEAPNYKCSHCDAVIQESSPSCTDLLFQHATIEHMPFKCYKCSKCGEQSNSNDSILEHYSNCLIARENVVASIKSKENSL